MNFILADRTGAADIYLEEQALPGVVRVAEAVAGDVFLVTGKRPELVKAPAVPKNACIVPMTLGHSRLAEALGGFPEIAGKREVYEIRLVKELSPEISEALVVCGSDKRGTIYGLFRLSELLGVSPWVDFADVRPKPQSEVVWDEAVETVSKEPSVRYRGFFINDEWPSFGNWTMEKNGGFNAVCYQRIFELLLRLKGNYLWPAMWSASFPLDGPGLANEELADEYGVVISFSHHEPCMRASEEWDKVKGADTKYGCEWNYYTNREGLLNYWRDGLARSGRFENIITIGMRGERDTSMLGPDATLSQNIELLRDIIREQRKLIAAEVNPNLSQVPQMLALYKEVEAYFYGNEDAKGLIGWEELEDVILMLCEDNFGNMRTLPDEQMRKHRGGYGMYYHFDYHGGPISYEWVNSTPLAKVWEQMTQAYEYGVRDLWIVNVGDLKPQELPLSYFLDLAYDYETYGIKHPNETERYTLEWVTRQFGGWLSEPENGGEKLEAVRSVLTGYTRLNNLRRPEALSRKTYHPVHEKEAARMLAACDRLEELAEQGRNALLPEAQDSYFELVYFPAVASLNLVRMQIYAGINGMLLTQGSPLADAYAEKTKRCIERDRELTRRYHDCAGGKWNHMMSSKHVGFVSWNDEGSDYPAVYTLAEWQALDEKPQTVVWECETRLTEEHLRLTEADCTPKARPDWCGETLPPRTFALAEGCISVEAEHFAEKTQGGDGAEWRVLKGYGRTLSSLKVLPNLRTYAPDGSGPKLVYRVAVPEAGTYSLTLYLAPSNPKKIGGKIRYGVQVADGIIDVVDSIPEGFNGGDCYNWPWCQDVLRNIRYSTSEVELQQGLNELKILAIDPGMVLQKLVLAPAGEKLPETYLGPRESWYQA